MTKNLYLPIAARRAAEQAYVNLTAKYAAQAQSEYVPFYNGRHSKRVSKSFDAYFYGNVR